MSGSCNYTMRETSVSQVCMERLNIFLYYVSIKQNAEYMNKMSFTSAFIISIIFSMFVCCIYSSIDLID